MAHPSDTSATGLLNLEKELMCFICTEVLYQPLTLIDCLHTFCGACLKEWFSHQHRKATHSHSPSTANPYTCPTCRASVKDAQHNAMINTLLDMFLAANPGKNRSVEEKAEMAKAYKSGEDILPKVDNSRRRDRRRREDESSQARERRMIEEARQRSLRDVRTTTSHSNQQLTPRNDHVSSRSREREERRERRREQERRDRRDYPQVSQGDLLPLETNESALVPNERTTLLPPTSPRHPDAVEARQRARTVAHQASLRSIVSASESGTGTGDSLNEALVMQEILAEGLLDGINVEALTEAEQDELSEIIAERYRQMHPRRSQQDHPTAPSVPHDDLRSRLNNLQINEPTINSQTSRQVPLNTRESRSWSRNVDQRINGNDNSVSTSRTSNADPTLTVPSTATGHRRRASDQSRGSGFTLQSRQTDPGIRSNPASRSATDVTHNSRDGSVSRERPRQVASTPRANTEPRQSSRKSEDSRSRPTGSDLLHTSSPPQTQSPHQSPPIPNAAIIPPLSSDNPNLNASISTHLEHSNLEATLPSQSTALHTFFEEPSIKCAKCSRPNIQYEVYKHCYSCNMDICQRCYRQGQGCNHWFGFGEAAMVNFRNSQPASRSSQAMEMPHLLVSRRYIKPVPEEVSSTDDDPTNVIKTRNDPASRLQEGHFCDRCHSFANDCYWSCDYCNDGEWGFCNDCVNTHHCCTHPLLPTAHNTGAPTHTILPTVSQISASALVPNDHHAAGPRLTPGHSPVSSLTSVTGASHPDYINLTITTHCDLCSQPIPPSQSRYHCPFHATPTSIQPDCTGDYDICTTCYHSRVKTGRIKREDGPAGWRKCLNGHRMVVTAFEADLDHGDRRVILHDLVGGTRMSEEDVKGWGITNNPATNQSQAGIESSPQQIQGQWTWREDHSGTRRTAKARTSISSQIHNKFPPDGGFGDSCLAVWSYYPEEGEEGKGELAFPRNAEIREVEEINDDWWYGVYAGDGGLFPTVFARRMDSIVQGVS